MNSYLRVHEAMMLFSFVSSTILAAAVATSTDPSTYLSAAFALSTASSFILWVTNGDVSLPGHLSTSASDRTFLVRRLSLKRSKIRPCRR